MMKRRPSIQLRWEKAPSTNDLYATFCPICYLSFILRRKWWHNPNSINQISSETISNVVRKFSRYQGESIIIWRSLFEYKLNGIEWVFQRDDVTVGSSWPFSAHIACFPWLTIWCDLCGSLMDSDRVYRNWCEAPFVSNIQCFYIAFRGA